MNNKIEFFRSAALGAMLAITPATAYAARGNDTPGSSAGGGGCNCEGGDSPSSSRNETSSGGRSSQSLTCGGEKVAGTNQAIYYAVASNISEPQNNRTTIALTGRGGIAITEGNRDFTTLSPKPNETLVQCANRAMQNLYNMQGLAAQGVNIETIKEGPNAHKRLRP